MQNGQASNSQMSSLLESWPIPNPKASNVVGKTLCQKGRQGRARHSPESVQSVSGLVLHSCSLLAIRHLSCPHREQLTGPWTLLPPILATVPRVRVLQVRLLHWLQLNKPRHPPIVLAYFARGWAKECSDFQGMGVHLAQDSFGLSRGL